MEESKEKGAEIVKDFSFKERSKDIFLLSCVPLVASGKAERSDAEKEAKKTFSPPRPPRRGRMQHEKSQRAVNFPPFWYRGTRDDISIVHAPCIIAVPYQGTLKVSRDDAIFFLMAGAWRRGEKKKNGEMFGSLKEMSYICSQKTIKIEDYGNNCSIRRRHTVST